MAAESACPDESFDLEQTQMMAEDEDEEPIVTCALCAHVIYDECDLGSRDYFVPGDRICACCVGEGELING